MARLWRLLAAHLRWAYQNLRFFVLRNCWLAVLLESGQHGKEAGQPFGKIHSSTQVARTVDRSAEAPPAQGMPPDIGAPAELRD